jgi:hypothetical protein
VSEIQTFERKKNSPLTKKNEFEDNITPPQVNKRIITIIDDSFHRIDLTFYLLFLFFLFY